MQVDEITDKKNSLPHSGKIEDIKNKFQKLSVMTKERLGRPVSEEDENDYEEEEEEVILTPQRLKIQLVNIYGLPINMNGVDFSFSLEIEYE